MVKYKSAHGEMMSLNEQTLFIYHVMDMADTIFDQKERRNQMELCLYSCIAADTYCGSVIYSKNGRH